MNIMKIITALVSFGILAVNFAAAVIIIYNQVRG